jgi:hypothetical protein
LDYILLSDYKIKKNGFTEFDHKITGDIATGATTCF